MTEGGAITAFCPFGSHHVVAAAEDNTIRVWNLRSGDCEMRLAGHTDRVTALCIAGNGELVSGSDDFSMRRWNLAAGTAAAVGTFAEKSITSLTPMGATQAIATCQWSSEFYNVSLADGSMVAMETGSSGPHIESSCAVDERHVAVGSSDGAIQIWDVTTGTQKKQLTRGGHEEGTTVEALCMIPNGSLVSGADDDTLRIWNLRTKRVLRVLEGHTDAVSAVCAVGQYHVASGSHDATVRLWDTTTGACVKVISEHTGTITGLCVVDGRLVSTSEDGRILVLDLAAGIRKTGLQYLARSRPNIPLDVFAHIAPYANVAVANIYGPRPKSSSRKTSSTKKTSSTRKTSSAKKKTAVNMNAVD